MTKELSIKDELTEFFLYTTPNGDIKVDETEADELFDLYIEELDKLSNAIDEMQVTEE